MSGFILWHCFLTLGFTILLLFYRSYSPIHWQEEIMLLRQKIALLLVLFATSTIFCSFVASKIGRGNPVRVPICLRYSHRLPSCSDYGMK